MECSHRWAWCSPYVTLLSGNVKNLDLTWDEIICCDEDDFYRPIRLKFQCLILEIHPTYTSCQYTAIEWYSLSREFVISSKFTP